MGIHIDVRDDLHLQALVEQEARKWDATHRRLRMWTYFQDTGKLVAPDGFDAATGYAGGNEGKNPEGVNNHDMQNVKKVGPIPVGFYTFGEVVLKSHLGPFAIPLMPDATNEMFGRSGFYCHGDTKEMNQSASQGCIIMPRNVRNDMWASPDHILQVKLTEVI